MVELAEIPKIRIRGFLKQVLFLCNLRGAKVRHIIQKINDHSQLSIRSINKILRSFTYKIISLGAIILLSAVLDSFSTKFLLIFFSGLFAYYLFNCEQRTIEERAKHSNLFKNSFLSKNKFNSALSRELLSIQFKLNKLLDEKNPLLKKIEDSEEDFDRKNFIHYLRAYEQYQDIAAFQCYRTPDGRDAGIIILLQCYASNEGNSEKKYYFDPLSELESFNEETLINLHSSGPIEYNRIKKLQVGDTIKAYVYDPEDLGFLDPYESSITVVSIEQPEHDAGRHVTFEIRRKRDNPWLMETSKGVIRTLHYLDL